MSECVNLGLTSTRRDHGSNLARMTGTAGIDVVAPALVVQRVIHYILAAPRISNMYELNLTSPYKWSVCLQKRKY